MSYFNLQTKYYSEASWKFCFFQQGSVHEQTQPQIISQGKYPILGSPTLFPVGKTHLTCKNFVIPENKLFLFSTEHFHFLSKPCKTQKHPGGAKCLFSKLKLLFLGWTMITIPTLFIPNSTIILIIVIFRNISPHCHWDVGVGAPGVTPAPSQLCWDFELHKTPKFLASLLSSICSPTL